MIRHCERSEAVDPVNIKETHEAASSLHHGE